MATPTTPARRRSPAPPSKAARLWHFVVSDSLRFAIPNASPSAPSAKSLPPCSGTQTEHTLARNQRLRTPDWPPRRPRCTPGRGPCHARARPPRAPSPPGCNVVPPIAPAENDARRPVARRPAYGGPPQPGCRPPKSHPLRGRAGRRGRWRLDPAGTAIRSRAWRQGLVLSGFIEALARLGRQLEDEPDRVVSQTAEELRL